MKLTKRQQVRYVLLFVACLWLITAVDFFIPAIDLTQWGLLPRSAWGALGIITFPLIHDGFGHVLGNSFPLVVLLTLLIGSRAETFATVLRLVLLGGLLLWLFGRAQMHVGASGLVYGLIAFLIVAGFREKKLLSLLVAILVGFLYGLTLLGGIIPIGNAGVSWDGHLFGAVAGVIVAYFTIPDGRVIKLSEQEVSGKR